MEFKEAVLLVVEAEYLLVRDVKSAALEFVTKAVEHIILSFYLISIGSFGKFSWDFIVSKKNCVFSECRRNNFPF